MRSSSGILACGAAAVFLFTACRRAPDLWASIPADSTLIAGADLAAMRASPIYPNLPSAARTFLSQFEEVSTALASYNGRDLLVAARGPFRAPPMGARMLAPDLALFGSPNQVRAAMEQFKTGRTGAPALRAQAETVAPEKQIWIVARGDTRLPIAGNAANLLAILRNATFVTLTARIGTDIALELRASAREERAARAIEETLRADLTLAAAGEGKHAELAAALRSATVSRAGGEVRVELRLTTAAAAGLFNVL